MISNEIFWALAVIDGIFIIYALGDSRNRVYGNIAAIGIATMQATKTVGKFTAE